MYSASARFISPSAAARLSSMFVTMRTKTRELSLPEAASRSARDQTNMGGRAARAAAILPVSSHSSVSGASRPLEYSAL